MHFSVLIWSSKSAINTGRVLIYLKKINVSSIKKSIKKSTFKGGWVPKLRLTRIFIRTSSVQCLDIQCSAPTLTIRYNRGFFSSFKPNLCNPPIFFSIIFYLHFSSFNLSFSNPLQLQFLSFLLKLLVESFSLLQPFPINSLSFLIFLFIFLMFFFYSFFIPSISLF